MSTPPPNSSTSGTAPQGEPPIAARFFGWLRRLGIVREERWVAGVCSGVANRIGIDPIVVRAIAIVVAVFGGPILFLYGIAWLLLPDADGDIVLERTLHRGWSPVLAGIVALIIIGCTPFAGGFWWFSGHWFGLGAGPLYIFGIFKTLWVLVIIGLCVWGAVALAILAKRNGLVGWNGSGARRWGGSGWQGTGPGWRGTGPGWRDTESNWSGTSGASPYGQQAPGGDQAANASGNAQAEPATNETGQGAAMPGGSGAGVGTVGGSAQYTVGGDGTVSGNPAWPGASHDTPTPGPVQGESFDARFADARSVSNSWRQDWYAQRNQWRQGLAEDRARIRAQRRAEADRSAARAAEWKMEREAYRAAHPHTPGWYFSLTLGLALLAGGVMAYCTNWWFGTDHYRGCLGLGASLFVIGLGMMVAALGRRHATALGWIGLLVLAVLLVVGGNELGVI